MLVRKGAVLVFANNDGASRPIFSSSWQISIQDGRP
jgi:hypothetical protein